MEVSTTTRYSPLPRGESLHGCEGALQVSHPALSRYPCSWFNTGECFSFVFHYFCIVNFLELYGES